MALQRARQLVLLLSVAGAVGCAASQPAEPAIESPRPAPSADVVALDGRCALGEISACGQLGVRYLRGYGAPRDMKLAETLLSRACDGGDADGCADLGELYVERYATGDDLTRAVELFRAACNQHSAKGCARLGRSMLHGLGVPVDREGGRKLLESTCKRGDPDGCLGMGSFYMTSGSGKTEYVMALAYFEQAVAHDGGHGTLGVMYWKGFGAASDSKRARELFEQGCARGEASACLNLGIMCQLGEGGDQDHAAALAHFRRACDLGEERGCAVDRAD